MKVLFLTGSINQGGAEFQILALARLFKEKGHDVEVFALTDYSFYKPYLAQHSIKYSHLLNKQSKLKRLWLTGRKMREAKPDVVIAYLRVVGQMAIFSRVLSLRSFKVLIGERTSLIIPRYDRYYFNLMRFTNYLTVNSVSKYRYIQERFPFLKTKTYFFPNILDIDSFKPTQNEMDGLTKISFVGRISPEKNVVELIKAMKTIIPDFSSLILNIYGDTRNRDYLEKVHEAVGSDENDSQYFRFHGKAANVLEVYRKTDLLCLISTYEGFSNVISEALCCGIPVIASDIDENRYLIEDGVNGFLVNPHNEMSIASGISKYLHLSDEAKSLISKNNRAKALKLFDSNKIYSDYISIINP